VWHVDGGALAPHYTAITGRAVTADELELYRLQWDLGEIAEYVADFAASHDDTEDTAIAFGGLGESIERSIDSGA
jgi:spectinomycin phosphotransferase